MNEHLELLKKEAQKQFLNGEFFPVNKLENGAKIENLPGIYCIKLKDGISLPKPFNHIPEDRIIYIGMSESSLRDRLWEQDLNHKSAATFFRSMGAILGFRPPKGSLYGKKTNNYKFSSEDTRKIINWMYNNLLIKWIVIADQDLKIFEKSLITDFCPLLNIQNNPNKSFELEKLREECRDIAKSSISYS